MHSGSLEGNCVSRDFKECRIQAYKMMGVKVLHVLLAVSALSAVAVHAQSNQSAIELLAPHDESFLNVLSLDQINKIMLTEVKEEFGGGRRLSKKESNSLWEKTMAYEWRAAEEREAKARQGGRRTQDGDAQGSSPFIVCDMHFGKTGESCKETVEASLGVHLIVSERSKCHVVLHCTCY
jgi:hypothetical protein